jgi:hypothetical protein
MITTISLAEFAKVVSDGVASVFFNVSSPGFIDII